MTFHELIDGEIILHEILQLTIENQIIIDGDDDEITYLIDIIQILPITMRDSDHVAIDGTYLVDENGTQ